MTYSARAGFGAALYCQKTSRLTLTRLSDRPQRATSSLFICSGLSQSVSTFQGRPVEDLNRVAKRYTGGFDRSTKFPSAGAENRAVPRDGL